MPNPPQQIPDGYQPQYYGQGYPPPPPNYQPVYVYVVPPPVQESASFLPGGFTSKEVRLKFIRKVYMILTVELLFTAGVVAWFLFHENTRKFVQKNILLVYISMLIFFVLYFVIICVRSARRKFPINLILLILVTIAESYMTATITSFYESEAVLMAIGITAFVTFAVTLFAMQTKYDFTTCGMMLFVAGLVLLVFGILAIVLRNKILSLIYSALAALLFTVYLIFDTQLIMGGRSIELNAEEYILAALMLYVDIIMIFINIANLLNSSSS